MRAWRRAALAAPVLLAASAARPAAQAADSAAPWRLEAGAEVGAPSGWVHVRENTIAGTRLGFGPGLGVHRVAVYTVGLGRRLGARTGLDLSVAATTLHGGVTLVRDVTFNGATLERGTTLRTDVGVPRFLTVTADVDRRVVPLGNGWLSVRGGVTFTGLTFVLRGTLAPGSALHETREDFVTQALPVPTAGVGIALPVAARLGVFINADGSFLPRVNSLRREGGEVTLQQEGASLTGGLRYDAARGVRIQAAYHASTFAQHERSTEDGNDIVVRSSGVALHLVLAW